MRKRILSAEPGAKPPVPGTLDVPSIATALVTSESAANPIENAFDSRSGSGGSRWVAGDPGDQAITLEFDRPQTIRRVVLEVEEKEMGRTQELQLSASCDGGQSYRELLRQEFNFSPQGATFQREAWSIEIDAATHLRLWVWPDKGDPPRLASVTLLSVGA